MLYTPHIDRAYELELSRITVQIDEMARLAIGMVRDAVRALLDHDRELADAVCETDERLDQMEIVCDQLCVALLAKRAPVGADLRMVTASLKLVTDLERIGDLAVNVARRAGRTRGPLGELPSEVAELAHCATDELALSLRALTTRDTFTARRLRAEDLSTDARNRAAFDRLLALASEKPDAFEDLLGLTNVCRQFERIGDHAVNIAEMVVFMVDGKIVRHQADVRASA